MSAAENRTLGDILRGLGRISETDVQTALEHQREHGGYFGEALVACGIVSEEELEFGLASQFDLPYLFPEAEAVDLEAVALVSPEWAMEHLTLPILKTDETLRVVIDSPLKDEPLRELALRTDLEVEVGLASPATIRELVRQVYARAAVRDEGHREPLSLENVLDAVHDAGSSRWGISVRRGRANAWWDENGTIRRRPVAGDWRESLESRLSPPPAQMVTETRSEWDGEIGHDEATRPVTVHCIVDESGREYLFLPREEWGAGEEPLPPPPPGIVTEIQSLARSGTARFAVVADPPELGHELLPHLPRLTLDPAWRSIYLNATDQPAAKEAFSVKLPSDPSAWGEEIEALEVFHFDVVTADLSGGDAAWANRVLDIASVAFLLWSDEEVESARRTGLRWRLGVRRSADGELEWSLESLDGTG